MSKAKGGVKNPRTQTINRRKGALSRLQAQLKRGMKNTFNAEDGTTVSDVLDEQDIKRIKKEIATLESRIK